MPLSRVLGERRGDPQARAELLCLLLVAAGEQPLLLRHGAGRTTYCLPLLSLSADEMKALGARLNTSVTEVKVGPRMFVALPVETGGVIGTVDAKYYHAGKQEWVGTVAVSSFE